MKLEAKNILITGGAGGIGSAIAAELLAAGAAVMLADRDAAALERTAERLAATERVRTVAVDLNDPAQLEALCEQAGGWRDGVDILINTVGVNHFGWLEDQSPAQIEQTLAINLLAPMRLCQAMLPRLRQRPAAGILNVGSVFGSIGYPGYAAYAASKFGLRGFTEALRRELADTSISCHCVAPRATRTGINSGAVDAMNDALGNTVDSPEIVARVVRRTLEKDRGFVVVGWPEKLFARLNAVLPAIVQRAIVGQLPLIRSFARSAGPAPRTEPTRRSPEQSLRRQIS